MGLKLLHFFNYGLAYQNIADLVNTKLNTTQFNQKEKEQKVTILFKKA